MAISGVRLEGVTDVWPRFNTRRRPFSRSSDDTTSAFSLTDSEMIHSSFSGSLRNFLVSIFSGAEQFGFADHAALEGFVEGGANSRSGKLERTPGSINTMRGW